MATGSKICKVCGKEYPYCGTKSVPGVFRWQDVACSPECGAEYLRRVQLSRGIKLEKEPEKYIIVYNEDYNGFDGELEEEYITEFGSDD